MKLTQYQINEAVRNYLQAARYQETAEKASWARFRSCRAEVCETSDYYLLRSYSTVVAVIDKATGTLWDALRMVYGYTATSAQHIAKFSNDYGSGMRYTWRDIPRR